VKLVQRLKQLSCDNFDFIFVDFLFLFLVLLYQILPARIHDQVTIIFTFVYFKYFNDAWMVHTFDVLEEPIHLWYLTGPVPLAHAVVGVHLVPDQVHLLAHVSAGYVVVSY